MRKANLGPGGPDASSGPYCYAYPHPALTADCCIFTFYNVALYILLVRRGLEPYRGMWALPGGFVRMEETVEECARRELREETGYDAERITQFHTYSEVGRDPRERVITVAFYALVKWDNVRGGDDASDAAWFPVTNLPPTAFDHSRIITDALKVMKRNIYFEPLGYELLTPEFSMSELQRVYERIMDTKFDRRNFYNKMRNTRMVIEVDSRNKKATSDGSRLGMSGKQVLSSGCGAHGKMDAGNDEQPVYRRRTNIRYRFNIEKFNDIFKSGDEPFKP